MDRIIRNFPVSQQYKYRRICLSSDDETNTRLPYFKEALEFVVQQNTDPEIVWESDINFLGELVIKIVFFSWSWKYFLVFDNLHIATADKTPEEREKLLMKVYESETEFTWPEHELGKHLCAQFLFIFFFT